MVLQAYCSFYAMWLFSNGIVSKAHVLSKNMKHTHEG